MKTVSKPGRHTQSEYILDKPLDQIVKPLHFKELRIKPAKNRHIVPPAIDVKSNYFDLYIKYNLVLRKCQEKKVNK